MGSTTTNGLPYPVGTDRVMDGDNAMQALAEAVDAKALFTGDSGSVSAATAGFSLVAGFTALSGSVRRRNGIVSVSLLLTSTNALAAGDVANTPCVNIPAGWQPLLRTGLTSAATGPGTFYSAEGTQIALTATTLAITAGGQLGIAGVWIV